MKQNVFQTGLNALANSSRTPVDQAQLIAILSTGEGPGHLMRALFEDCSLGALDAMAAQAGLSPRQLSEAYAIAKATHCARNPELDLENTGF